MSEIFKLVFFVFVIGIFSCFPNSKDSNDKRDSFLVDTSVTGPETIEWNDTDSGLSALAKLNTKIGLLKFPITLAVDSFVNKEGVPVQIDTNFQWFADFIQLPAEPNVKAMGKFYVNANTLAIVFLATAPNDTDGSSGNPELILSLFDVDSEKVNSGIVAYSKNDTFEKTIMIAPNQGKSFIHQETEEINVTLQKFTIVNREFVLGELVGKKFPSGQDGHDEYELFIESWMK